MIVNASLSSFSGAGVDGHGFKLSTMLIVNPLTEAGDPVLWAFHSDDDAKVSTLALKLNKSY